MEDVNPRRHYFFSLNLGPILRILLQGNSPIYRVGKFAMKVERTRIHFTDDIFAIVTVLFCTDCIVYESKHAKISTLGPGIHPQKGHKYSVIINIY